MKSLKTFLTEQHWPLDKITRLLSSKQSENLTEAQALYNSGEFTENRLLQIYKELYDVQVISLANSGFLTAETKSFGIKKCIDNRVIFCTFQHKDYVVVEDPSDPNLRSLLQDGGVPLSSLAVTTRAELSKYIDAWVQPLLITQLSADIEAAPQESNDLIDLTQVSDNAILNIINNLVTMAYQTSASDIQIIPSKFSADVYFRVDGRRIHKSAMSINSVPPLHRVLGNLAGQQTDDEHKMLQGKLEFRIGDKPLEVRLNIIPTKLGSSINLRIHSQKEFTVSSITSSLDVQKVLSAILNLSDGLIVFCGPTGSGKSTTMAAIARQLLSRQLNICSVEDPVELVCPGINQVDVVPAKGLDYFSVTKSFMRHDPDVIIIGEIRDKDVANVALQAADTGHLIMTTLHARSAVSAISRLLSLGVDRATLADNLTVIISQRLVRKVCPFCYRSKWLDADDPNRQLFNIPNTEKFEYHLASGCTQCNNTGYLGRTTICEYLIVTEEIQDAIERGADSMELAHLAGSQTWHSLLEDGIEKVRQGHTTFEELKPFLMASQLRRGDLLT